MLSLHAVEIAVENAWIAGAAEKDETVGERFEEAFNWGFNSLARLGIVVHDHGLGGNVSALPLSIDVSLSTTYHRVDRFHLNKRLVKDSAHIRAL